MDHKSNIKASEKKPATKDRRANQDDGARGGANYDWNTEAIKHGNPNRNKNFEPSKGAIENFRFSKQWEKLNELADSDADFLNQGLYSTQAVPQKKQNPSGISAPLKSDSSESNQNTFNVF